MSTPFVPADFDVPHRLVTDRFELLPLTSEHNERDYLAWTTSIEHIHSTPGFGGSWPHPMTLEQNRADLVGHAEDFAARRGFTYTVLEPHAPTFESEPESAAEVIGCVYIYPVDPSEPTSADHDARVRSWVRVSRAELDVVLWRAVTDWLASRWPFISVAYAPRPGPG